MAMRSVFLFHVCLVDSSGKRSGNWTRIVWINGTSMVVSLFDYRS